MGMLVRQWIINKLGLPVPDYSDAPVFRHGVSNGFIIAEILRKYSIISDDQLIALPRNFTQGTKAKNMKNIHRWMVEAGITLIGLDELLDVAEEKAGAVVQALYKLYFALEGGQTVLQRESPSKHNLQTTEDTITDFDYGIDSEEIIADMRSRLDIAKEVGVELEDTAEPKATSSSNSLGDEFQPPIPECVSLLGQESDVVDENVEYRLLECPLISPAMQAAAYNVADAQEITKVYFASEATSQLKRGVLSQKTKNNGGVVAAGSLASFQQIDFSGITETERIRLLEMKAKVEREYKLAKEMGTFDTLLDETAEIEEKESKERDQFRLLLNLEDNGPVLPPPVKIHPRNAEPVRPSPVGMQIRLNRLKCERKEELAASEERVRLRRSLCAKMIKKIPLRIHEDLVATALSKTNEIFSSKEVELSEFLINMYRSKNIFLDHLREEGNALQNLRCNRSELLAQDKERKENLVRMESKLLDQRAQRIEEEKAEKEMALLLKIIYNQLNMMIRLATRIGDYRQLANEDPSPEQIAEWKAWLLLGLETPIEVNEDQSSESEEMEFDLADGKCRIVLSDVPIPNELHPHHQSKLQSAHHHTSRLFEVVEVEAEPTLETSENSKPNSHEGN